MIYTNFEKHYKDAIAKTQELTERIKEVNEFWMNAVLSSAKEFFNTAKTK